MEIPTTIIEVATPILLRATIDKLKKLFQKHAKNCEIRLGTGEVIKGAIVNVEKTSQGRRVLVVKTQEGVERRPPISNLDLETSPILLKDVDKDSYYTDEEEVKRSPDPDRIVQFAKEHLEAEIILYELRFRNLNLMEMSSILVMHGFPAPSSRVKALLQQLEQIDAVQRVNLEYGLTEEAKRAI